MGHGNMMLAVAGLNDQELKLRTKNLATGNWQVFLPAERHAYAFAIKLSASPKEVTPDDTAALIETFGPHRAVDIIYYSSWVNYMTRVADAFQLPLERENVFATSTSKPATEKAPVPMKQPSK
jgi:hypothetical protein